MNNKKVLNAVFGALAFIIPFALYYYTHPASLAFADAGEFALVTKIDSVAHGPGFPAYIFLGWLWSIVTGVFIHSHLLKMILFSITSASATSLLMYLTTRGILERSYPTVDNILVQCSALGTALAMASGFTIWLWAGNVEVYAFQVFTFALLMYGLIEYNNNRQTKNVVIAAVGLALGLCNHHLTTILFMPFMLFFAGKNIFAAQPTTKAAAKGKKTIKQAEQAGVMDFLKSRQFGIFVAVTGVLGFFFYGWMMYRATVPLPFKFGSPDNLSRFFYHVSGGAWTKNVEEQVEGIVGMRFPYFMWLIARQYSFFIILIALGIFELFTKKWNRYTIALIGYFLLVFMYQVRFNQVGDSDGYMIMPFYALGLFIPFGAIFLAQRNKFLLSVLPVMFVVQVFWNFPLNDRRQFDLSPSLMKSLDESSPKNSVVLVSDWTLVSEYYYYRIAENFRPDMVVIYYDFKFTNWTILPILYPDFYKLIKPEYDHFVEALGAEHPQEIYNTGCSLSTPALQTAYRDLFNKISAVCAQNNRALMFDPKTFVYYLESKTLTSNAYVSGCFVSTTKTGLGASYTRLPFKWLDHPEVAVEPAAGDKLVDMQAMLDFNARYYQGIGDTVNYNNSIQSHDKIMRLQAKLKDNFEFMFLPSKKQ